MLTVIGSGKSPEAAAALSNGVANAMVEYVSELERPSDDGSPLAKLTVVSEAVPNGDPVSPNTRLYCVIGAAIGLVLGGAVVVVRNRLDNKLRDRSQATDVTGVPVLVEVPEDISVSDGLGVDFSTGSSLVSESYRKLRASLDFLGFDGSARSILITSAVPGEGKTSTAVNLAKVIAESGSSVVLVDADMRRPAVARRLGLTSEIGLSDCLRGEIDWDHALQKPLPGSSLQVIAGGQCPPNPSELLASERARGFFTKLEERFEYVIVDSPPVIPVVDAALLSRICDSVLLVARVGKVKIAELDAAIEELAAADSQPRGLVLNGVMPGEGAYSYEYGSPSKVRA
ncbi:polysaccharide biosynthesis tyrosine autokinase [Gordonia sp. NB41Y]|uniref:polysaccharide biosynthesis tyrosine autokinase n=1 Tax=Gordonia sp. NB41Y TaxID=875808 RepID=UPI0021C9A99E|nr:polysaccharide biosynthesis tyrosine autokinase [Gordonia sp. NB41Y]WLP92121.1 polysaccharide biosynthesis tyrosine autokinase [Gordonia sp. NB41Y]